MQKNIDIYKAVESDFQKATHKCKRKVKSNRFWKNNGNRFWKNNGNRFMQK